MSVEHDDETAFHARCDELIEQFASWLSTTDLPGAAAGDARILLDWKCSYEEGRLGSWTTEHLERFLLGWCPRKLSTPSAECEDFPISIGGFCLFLGPPAPGSDPPSQLWSWCERHVRRFVAEMAKGIFARVGGLEPGQDLSPDGLAELMERAQALPRDAIGEVVDGSGEPADPLTVGPVRLPDPAQRAESAAAAPALRQLQQLSEFCSPPGRSLTQKGTLRHGRLARTRRSILGRYATNPDHVSDHPSCSSPVVVGSTPGRTTVSRSSSAACASRAS